MLYETFGKHSLSWTVVLDWHSHFKDGRVLKMTNIQGYQAPAKRQKMLKKFENSFTKTIAEQSICLQTPLGSVMEFARRLQKKT
jgi:hypothetical protein